MAERSVSLVLEPGSIERVSYEIVWGYAEGVLIWVVGFRKWLHLKIVVLDREGDDLHNPCVCVCPSRIRPQTVMYDMYIRVCMWGLC